MDSYIDSGAPKSLSGKGHNIFIIENPPSEVEALNGSHNVDKIHYLLETFAWVTILHIGKQWSCSTDQKPTDLKSIW